VLEHHVSAANTKMKNTDYLLRALKDGHIQLITAGKTKKVRYVAVNHAEKWSDPEEKVRAAYFAELIYRYGYSPDCIGIEVTVPDRTPVDRADLVVFQDSARTRPFAVIECKRDAVSDTEFKQAVDQGFGNGCPRSTANPKSSSTTTRQRTSQISLPSRAMT